MVMESHPIRKDACELMFKGVQALARMERNGIRVDVDYCRKMQNHLTRQINHLRSQLMGSDFIHQWRGKYGKKFNMTSNPQLGDMLFSHLGIVPLKRTNPTSRYPEGQPSVDEESLEATGVPEVKTLIRIRRLTKARDTSLKNLLEEQVDGRVHTNFNLHIAATYRPSTDSPNLANVPTRNPEIKQIVRSGIVADEGCKLMAADFKGIEVSIAYNYHKDPEMKIYLLDKSTDMHRDMAMKLYLLEKEQMNKAIRHSGKNRYVFPEFYGSYWKNCASDLWIDAHEPTHDLPDGTPLLQHLASKGLTNLTAYEEHVRGVEDWMWNVKWKVYTAWKESWLRKYIENGYLETLTGFRCQGEMTRNQVINYPIQGSAFHCMLQCIIWIDEDIRKEGWKTRLCNQIYDDLMLNVPPEEEQMVVDRLRLYMRERLPEHWPWIQIPLDVDIEATPVNGSWFQKSTEHIEAVERR